MKSQELLDAHARVSQIVGSQWGVGWTYRIVRVVVFNKTTTLSIIFGNKPCNTVDVTGESIVDALDSFVELYSESIRNLGTAKSNVGFTANKYLISQEELNEMIKWMNENYSVYRKQFARLVSQGEYVEPQDITIEQGTRIYETWLQFKSK